MASSELVRTQRLRRSAALALHHAISALRQHPAEASLRHAALRRCLECVQAATVDGPLQLDLHADQVLVAGQAVPGLGAADGPFAALHGAGIGAIVLAAAIPPAAIAELVQRLAQVHAEADAEAAYRSVAAPGLSHVQLRAGGAAVPGARPPSIDWWCLPGPAPIAKALRPLVARDLASNLPARAARQLLDDLELAPLANGEVLAGLFTRLLADGDLGTATWLLGEVAHHPNVPAGAHRRLLAAAEAHADERWLRQQLDQGTRDELMALAAFVMELGEACAERFAAIAADTAQPWSRWLCDLLGRGA